MTQSEPANVTPTHEPAELDVKYLDLDGDGVPDAVQIVEAVPIDLTGDGVTDAVEVTEEIDSEIGVDGVPEQVDIVDITTVELPDPAKS